MPAVGGQQVQAIVVKEVHSTLSSILSARNLRYALANGFR